MLEGKNLIVYYRIYSEVYELSREAKLKVEEFISNMQETFKEANKSRVLKVTDWEKWIDNATIEAKHYALDLAREAELNSYQQKVISAISHEEVNWQRVQSKVQWIGNFSGHQVAYNQILQLPPITDEFEEAILAYNRAVVTLRKEASRQSLLFVDIRKELDTSKKHT